MKINYKIMFKKSTLIINGIFIFIFLYLLNTASGGFAEAFNGILSTFLLYVTTFFHIFYIQSIKGESSSLFS